MNKMSLYNYEFYLNFIVFTNKLHLAITGIQSRLRIWYLYSKITRQFCQLEKEMALKQGQQWPEISLEDK